MLAAIPLLAVAVVDGVAVLGRHVGSETAHHGSTAPPATREHAAQTEQRTATAMRALAIRALLVRRADAVLHHNRAEWRSTLDPDSKRFRRTQMQMFDNLQQVRFSSWSYTFSPAATQRPNRRGDRYGAATWSPLRFGLHYRLRGFDKQPTDLAQFPTFVDRNGSWYLASLSDFRADGMHSSLDLWDFGPVVTVRTSSV